MCLLRRDPIKVNIKYFIAVCYFYSYVSSWILMQLYFVILKDSLFHQLYKFIQLLTWLYQHFVVITLSRKKTIWSLFKPEGQAGAHLKDWRSHKTILSYHTMVENLFHAMAPQIRCMSLRFHITILYIFHFVCNNFFTH